MMGIYDGTGKSALDEYLKNVESYFDKHGGQLAGIVNALDELASLRAKLKAADELAGWINVALYTGIDRVSDDLKFALENFKKVDDVIVEDTHTGDIPRGGMDEYGSLK